jgi:hypothetical protein
LRCESIVGENHYALEQALGEPVIVQWNGSSPYGASSVTPTWNGSITLKLQCTLRSEGTYSVYSQICTYLRQARASPPVLSMVLQTVKFIVKKSKCVSLSQEIGFFGTKLVQLAVADKSCNTVVHLKKRVQ